MCKTLSKLIYILLFFSLQVALFSQEYKIDTVTYDIEGSTREYPLRKAVEIDTERVFSTKEDLEMYIDDLIIQLQNQRVLESAEILTFYGSDSTNNLIPVNLIVKSVDTFNIFGFPYPKVDTNYGVELKLSLKNYNFLGSMLPLDFDLAYQYDTEEEDGIRNNDHIFGINTSFSLPFKVGIFDTEWTNALDFSYTIGDSIPKTVFDTSYSASYDINEIVSIKAGVTQGIGLDPGYSDYGDSFYLKEGAEFSIPITLAKTDTIGNITWTPKASLIYFWDPLDYTINVSNEDLIDTNLTLEHSLAFGRVNWVENFKDGYSFDITQKYIQNIYENNFSLSSSLEFQYFKAFKHLGIKSKANLFTMNNDTEELGTYIRGIRNNDIDTNSALLINLDLPIKIWETDWVGYGLWDWTKNLDFEMQLSPFIDIALGYNPEAKTTYDFKDGWYGAGIEILGYLSAARSVVGRISFAIDIADTANKLGNSSGTIKSVSDKLFNHSWRSTDDWYEFSLGIGLFY